MNYTDPVYIAVAVAALIVLIKALVWHPTRRKLKRRREQCEGSIAESMRNGRTEEVRVGMIRHHEHLSQTFKEGAEAWVLARDIARPSEVENELRMSLASARASLEKAQNDYANSSKALRAEKDAAVKAKTAAEAELTTAMKVISGEIGMAFRERRIVLERARQGSPLPAKQEEEA